MNLPLNMNYLDIALVVVLALFALRGSFRGLIDELSGLVGLLFAFMLAGNLYPQFGKWLLRYVNGPEFIDALAYSIILCSGLVIALLVAQALKKLFNAAQLGWANHLLGFVIGAVKGVIVCAFMVSLFITFIGKAPFIQTSQIVPYINEVSRAMAAFFPFQP